MARSRTVRAYEARALRYEQPIVLPYALCVTCAITGPGASELIAVTKLAEVMRQRQGQTRDQDHPPMR